MPDQDGKRRTFSYAFQNGTGLVISRLIIMAMPFVMGGAIWAGKLIVELTGEKVMSAIERVEKRLDRFEQTTDVLQKDDVSLDKRVTRVEDSVTRLEIDQRRHP